MTEYQIRNEENLPYIHSFFYFNDFYAQKKCICFLGKLYGYD